MSDDPRRDRDGAESNTPAVGEWEVREGAVLAETKLFTLRERHSRSPSDPAKCGEFVYIDSPDWVNVVALTREEEVVLIEQFRHGIGEITLEIPGGTIDEGEDPITAGVRELREETGYVGADATLIGTVTPNPAILNNRCHTLLVRDATRSHEPELEGTEEIHTRLAPLSEIPRLMRSGAIHHALVVAAFHHLGLREPGS